MIKIGGAYVLFSSQDSKFACSRQHPNLVTKCVTENNFASREKEGWSESKKKKKSEACCKFSMGQEA